jgi:hypothetical protein
MTGSLRDYTDVLVGTTGRKPKEPLNLRPLVAKFVAEYWNDELFSVKPGRLECPQREQKFSVNMNFLLIGSIPTFHVSDTRAF